MIPTLNTVTAGGGLSLADYVDLAARHDFHAVDFDVVSAQKLGFDAVAAIFEKHDILPAAFGLTVEWRKDEETFQSGLDALPELAKLAQDLGSTRCCTWVLPDSGAPVADYAATSTVRFVKIAEVLAANGIRLGLEFLGPRHFRPNPANVWFYDIAGALGVADEINQITGTANVGLLVDCWHWYAGGGRTMDLASIPLEQIVHVHINDAPKGVVLENLVDSVRELPGATGEIDITGFLTTLAALGYDGPIAVETFSEALKKMTPDEAAAAASESVKKVFQAAGVKPMHLL